MAARAHEAVPPPSSRLSGLPDRSLAARCGGCGTIRVALSILRFPGVAAASRLFRGRRLGRFASSLNAGADTDPIVKHWEEDGRPVPPPPEVKQQVLRRHAKQYGLRTFVETGTFFGDTTAALEPHLDELVTIE